MSDEQQQQHSGNASVTCLCGRCKISFNGGRDPVCRYLCGCVDCRQAVAWAASRGGPAVPAGRFAPLLDLVYLPADLTVDRGADLLEFYLLREGGKSRRGVTACCSSTLVIDHPSYRGRKVLVFPGVSVLDAAPRGIDAVIYTSDLSDDQRAALTERPHGAPLDPGPGDAHTSHRVPLNELELPRRGLSMEELIAASGGVTTLGLVEGASC